jgi:hypothetical protein
MPKLRTYHIFISHSWSYDEHDRIIDFLDDSYPYFLFKDFSVSRAKRLMTRNDTELRKKLRHRIKCAHIILVPAGMEVSRRYWLNYEIECARSFDKPVLGIYLLGQLNTPKLIGDVACDIVSWRRDKILGAIREYAL